MMRDYNIRRRGRAVYSISCNVFYEYFLIYIYICIINDNVTLFLTQHFYFITSAKFIICACMKFVIQQHHASDLIFLVVIWEWIFSQGLVLLLAIILLRPTGFLFFRFFLLFVLLSKVL